MGTSDTDQPEVIIIKASQELKRKAGTGGFDPAAIKNAETRLEAASLMFPAAAEQDISLIEEALELIAAKKPWKDIKLTIQAATVELKSHSIMFRFPLVTVIAESLLRFCGGLTEIQPLAGEVIGLHLKTLRIAINQGPRAITDNDRVALLSGLEKASAKVLREKV
ncbi:MAG: hypothetical protein JWM96_1180 [Alphaproteobacteria bacterium]|nr:hypothetical protein [Alphaproteobacteria bacterium]